MNFAAMYQITELPVFIMCADDYLYPLDRELDKQ
jgi:hypothetical protein